MLVPGLYLLSGAGLMRVCEHVLRTCLFIPMCARIYRREYACVYIWTRVYARVCVLSPPPPSPGRHLTSLSSDCSFIS